MENKLIEDIKPGTKIKHLTGEGWVNAEVESITKHFVKFKGSGFERVKKTTLLNYPQFYQIIEL